MDVSGASGFCSSSLGQLATEVESEILVLLLMSPEESDELAEMFTDEDQQKLLALGGTVQAGLDGATRRLVDRGLVVGEGSLDSGNKVWQLTRRGERVARRLIPSEK